MRGTVMALTAAAALAACGPRYEIDPSRSGPYPTAYRQAAMQYVRTSFFDPYSIRDASISVPDRGRIGGAQGWIVCVRSNAKNRMGGYIGLKTIALLVYQGAVVDSLEGTDVCDLEKYDPFPEIETIGAKGK